MSSVYEFSVPARQQVRVGHASEIESEIQELRRENTLIRNTSNRCQTEARDRISELYRSNAELMRQRSELYAELDAAKRQLDVLRGHNRALRSAVDTQKANIEWYQHEVARLKQLLSGKTPQLTDAEDVAQDIIRAHEAQKVEKYRP